MRSISRCRRGNHNLCKSRKAFALAPGLRWTLEGKNHPVLGMALLWPSNDALPFAASLSCRNGNDAIPVASST